MIYVGIDNGVSGALAAVSDHPGPPVGMIPMPVTKARKGTEIDVRAVVIWLEQVSGGNLASVSVVIEEPGGSKSAKAASSMAGSFHALRALLDILRVRWERITPQKWQKEMVPGCPAGDTKHHALAKARRLWPHETFLASPRSKVPHDGMIDAALIAEFGRIKNL